MVGLNSAWLRAQDRSKWRSVVETGKLVATGDSVLVVERRQQKERATSCEECLNGTGTSSVFALFKEHWQRYQLHGLSTLKTSSSAVANRSRDASCLSVVSFNSRPTKRRVDSFIVSYIGYRTAHFFNSTQWRGVKKMRCSVVFGVTLMLLVINILSSSSAINTTAYYQRSVTLTLARRWPWSTGDRVDNTCLL